MERCSLLIKDAPLIKPEALEHISLIAEENRDFPLFMNGQLIMIIKNREEHVLDLRHKDVEFIKQPYGRLIDADQLIERIRNEIAFFESRPFGDYDEMCRGLQEAIGLICTTQTIIGEED
ncbi:MAG: hypothetical protein IKN72_06000 [Clostridia bacterium]|nr:hypothetical protein [Clostridia bacterium]